MNFLSGRIKQLLDTLNALPADKVAHFASGVVLFFLLVPFMPSVLSLAVVSVAAFAKEAYDLVHKDRHTPDGWDAAATIAGGLVGLFCTFF